MSDLEDLTVMDQNHSCVQKLDLCVPNRALCPTLVQEAFASLQPTH